LRRVATRLGPAIGPPSAEQVVAVVDQDVTVDEGVSR